MLGGDVFILQPAGFFIRQVNDALDARRDEDLPLSTSKNAGFGTGAQNVIQPFRQHGWVHFEDFQDLRNHSLGLFNQCQEHMFGINLVMPVALDDLGSTLGSFLGSFSKTIKSHHRFRSFLFNPFLGLKAL